MDKNEMALQELQKIPGVGPVLARGLYDLGLRRPEDLRGKDPQKLYHQLIQLKGHHVDRCVLYVFRCAVYCAEHATPDPELLKWWNWKDRPDEK